MLSMTQMAKTGIKFSRPFVLNNLNIRTPFHAQWELLYRCNLRCDFCNVWRDDTYDKNRLPREQALALVDQLADAGILFLNITGGEPLLVPHAPEILHRARARGIMTSMNCNGVFIQDRIKELEGSLDKIFLSLDSPYAALHEELRGQKGCYAKTIKGIELCRDAGMNTAINMTVTAESFDQMEDMALLARDMDVALYMRPVSVIPTEFSNNANAAGHAFSKETYVKRMRELKAKYPHIKTSDAYLNFIVNGGFNSFQCRAMELSINVKPDGAIVLPCGYFPVHKFQREGRTVKELVHSPDFQEKSAVKWYDFCTNCTLSCFFVPAAMMRVENILSIVESYAK